MPLGMYLTTFCHKGIFSINHMQTFFKTHSAYATPQRTQSTFFSMKLGPQSPRGLLVLWRALGENIEKDGKTELSHTPLEAMNGLEVFLLINLAICSFIPQERGG